MFSVFPGIILDFETYPFRIILTSVPSQETPEEYVRRCQDVADYATKSAAHLNQPTGFNFDDISKYRKVGEGSYESVTPGHESEEAK